MQAFLASCSQRLGLGRKACIQGGSCPLPAVGSSPSLRATWSPVLRSHLSGSSGSSELGKRPRFKECPHTFVFMRCRPTGFTVSTSPPLTRFFPFLSVRAEWSHQTCMLFADHTFRTEDVPTHTHFVFAITGEWLLQDLLVSAFSAFPKAPAEVLNPDLRIEPPEGKSFSW